MRLTALCALVTTALLGAVAPAPVSAAPITLAYEMDVTLTGNPSGAFENVVVVGFHADQVAGWSAVGAGAPTFTLTVDETETPESFLVLGTRGTNSVVVSFGQGVVGQSGASWSSIFGGLTGLTEAQMRAALTNITTPGSDGTVILFASDFADPGSPYGTLALGETGHLISFTVADYYGTVTIRTATDVPEPATVALLGAGAVALAARPRRRAR